VPVLLMSNRAVIWTAPIVIVHGWMGITVGIDMTVIKVSALVVIIETRVGDEAVAARSAI
jgi:hypothetical protein